MCASQIFRERGIYSAGTPALQRRARKFPAVLVDNGSVLRNKFRAPICPCERPPKNLRCARQCEQPDRHLDSKFVEHHDAHMRTTVTLDSDVEQMLRSAMHRSRQSFKATLNGALRAGLAAKSVQARRARFVVKARPMGLRPGIDPSSLNKLADDLEADSVMAKARRMKLG